MDVNSNERRRQTRSNVYHYLYGAQEFCTRQSLAQALDLSLPTIYQNLTDLVDAGLVRYAGQSQSTGGRKASGLAIVPDARVAVGIALTEDRLRFSAADLRLNEIAYHKVSHTSNFEMEELGTLVARELEQFLDTYHIDRSRLLGVCIAMAGVTDPEGGHLLYAPTMHLRNVELSGLTRSIPYPTYVENDATCSGYAEWFMRGDQENLAYLSLENGVGGAFISNGIVYGGDNRRSAEFGHLCVEPGGLPCACGKWGCLEAYCSDWRIRNTFGVSLKEFFEGVNQGNPEYAALWKDFLFHLAIGASNIRMALDCTVVLGGFMSQYLDPYLPMLREYAAANDPFERRADYLQLGILRSHAVSFGIFWIPSDSLQKCRCFPAAQRRKSPRCARRTPCHARCSGHSIPLEAGCRPLELPRHNLGGFLSTQFFDQPPPGLSPGGAFCVRSARSVKSE